MAHPFSISFLFFYRKFEPKIYLLPPLAQEWNIEAEPIIYWAMEKNATIGSYIEKPYIILSQSFSSIVIKALHYIKDMKGYE